MTSKQRWFKSCTAAVFSIVAIGYLFWIPYDEGSLYRAIPASADLVTAHRNPGERWPQLVTNMWFSPFPGYPQSAALSSRNGAAPTVFDRLTRVMRLSSHETLVAHLPATGKNGQPAWMIASWIGGWSPCLRWALLCGRWPGISAQGFLAGHTIWKLENSATENQQIYFACGDGVFLACLSSDASAIHHVIMAYEGLTPATGASAELTANSQSHYPDRAWFQPRTSPDDRPFTLTGALTRFDDRGLAATFRLQPSPWKQTKLVDNMDAAGVTQIFGDLPALVMALPLATIRDGLVQNRSLPAWLDSIRLVLQSDLVKQDNNGLVLALFTGEFGGGYGRKPFRLSIPAVTAMIRVKQPEKVRSMIGDQLDFINARHRLGLIQDPVPSVVGTQTIHTIEITGITSLITFEPGDRPAYTLSGDWLIISSQADSLVKLLRRVPEQPEAPRLNSAAWQSVMTATNTSGLVWVDLERGGKSLQLALTMWGISRRTSNPEGSIGQGALKFGRTFLDRIAPLKSFCLRMEPEGSNAVVRLEIGQQLE